MASRVLSEFNSRVYIFSHARRKEGTRLPVTVAFFHLFTSSLYTGWRSNENEARVKIRAQQRTVGAAARKNVLLSRPCVLIFASLRIWVDLVKSSERKISADPTRARRLAFHADFMHGKRGPGNESGWNVKWTRKLSTERRFRFHVFFIEVLQ